MKNLSIPIFSTLLASSVPVYTVTITSPLNDLTTLVGPRLVTVSVSPSVSTNTSLRIYDGVDLVATGTVGAGATTSALAVGAHVLTASITVNAIVYTSAPITITCQLASITMLSAAGAFAPRVHLYEGQEDAEVLWTLADGTTSSSLTPTSTIGGEHTLSVNPSTAIECLNFGYDGGDGGNQYSPEAIYTHTPTTLTSISGIQNGAPNLHRFLANRTLSLIEVDLSNLPLLMAAEFFLSEIRAVNYAGCVALRRTCHEQTNISVYDVSDSLVFEDMRGRGQDIDQTPLVITLPADVSNVWHICVGSQLVPVQGLEDLISGAIALPSMNQWWTWAGRMGGVLAINGTMQSLLADSNLHTGFDTTNITWGESAACDLRANPLTSLVLAGTTTLNRQIHFNFGNCGMTQTLVDYAIQTLAGGTGINGTLDLSGNANASYVRTADVATLRGRGWTVTVLIDSATQPITLTSGAGTFAPRVHLFAGQEDATVLWTFADTSTSTSLTPSYVGAGTHTLQVTPSEAIETLNFGYAAEDGGETLTPVATYGHSTTTLTAISGLAAGAPNLYRFLACGCSIESVDFDGLDGLGIVECFACPVLSVASHEGCTDLIRVCYEDSAIMLLDVSDATALEDIRGRNQDIGNTPFVVTLPTSLPDLWHLCIGTQDVPVQGVSAITGGTRNMPAMAQLWLWGGGFSGTLAPSGTMTSLLAQDNAFDRFDSTNISWGGSHTCNLAGNPLTTITLAGASTLAGAMQFDFTGCGMTRTLVDYIIHTLAAGTGSAGVLTLTGNDDASFDRTDDVATLRARGWTVTVTVGADVSDFEALTAQQIIAAAGQRIMLQHASVGTRTSDALDVMELADADYNRTNFDFQFFNNTDPLTLKYSAFLSRCATNEATHDVLGFKLCFLDRAAIASEYLATMETAESTYPGLKFLYTTLPLTPMSSLATVAAYNATVRDYCTTHNKVLWDIAYVESHHLDGTMQTYNGYECLAPEWDEDGGHPNAAGAEQLAHAFWVCAAQLAEIVIPAITSFIAPAISMSQTIPITTWTVSNAPTHYIVTVDSTDIPVIGVGAWTTSAWTQVVTNTDGYHTLRAYVHNGTHISRVATQTTAVDTVAPIMTAFVVPDTSSSTVTFITPPTATNATAYAVTVDTTDIPSLGSFVTPAPQGLTGQSEGVHTYRAYARDAAGNISTPIADSCTVSLGGAAPEITAFVMPTIQASLSNIPVTTLTVINDPTEYAVIAQSASLAAPSTPTTGWSGTVPTTVTIDGTADGLFTVYVWARSGNGTSTYAEADVLVLQTNATLTLGSILSANTARVTFTYTFANAAEANDWAADTGITRTVTGGNLVFTGTGLASGLWGANWHGLTSRTYANSRIQLESATSSAMSPSGTVAIGALVYGHSDSWVSIPYNESPSYLMQKMRGADYYQMVINEVITNGGGPWAAPSSNTMYDFSYSLSPTNLTIASPTHGEYSVNGTYPLTESPQHVHIGIYNGLSTWGGVTLTGIVNISDAPVITAHTIPATAQDLSGIASTSLTATNTPTEWASVVQLSSAAAPAVPTTGWGAIPTSFTAPGSTSGFFTVYVWARNGSGTSAVATAEVLVLLGNAASVSLVTKNSNASAVVAVNYDFATSAQGNDWTPMGPGCTLAVTDGAIRATFGTGGNLHGMRWAHQMAVSNITYRCQSSANVLANVVLGHGELYNGEPFNPNPGFMTCKGIYYNSYESHLNGVGGQSMVGVAWTPLVNTMYDFVLSVASNEIRLTHTADGTYHTRTAGAPFALASTVGYVSFGHYQASGAWDSILLTGTIAL